MELRRPQSEFSDVDNAKIPADYVKMLDAQRFITGYTLQACY